METIEKINLDLLERQRIQKIKIASLPKDENYFIDIRSVKLLFPNITDSEILNTIGKEDCT